jgi:hypothetical protein
MLEEAVVFFLEKKVVGMEVKVLLILVFFYYV